MKIVYIEKFRSTNFYSGRRQTLKKHPLVLRLLLQCTQYDYENVDIKNQTKFSLPSEYVMKF